MVAVLSGRLASIITFGLKFLGVTGKKRINLLDHFVIIINMPVIRTLNYVCPQIYLMTDWDKSIFQAN